MRSLLCVLFVVGLAGKAPAPLQALESQGQEPVAVEPRSVITLREDQIPAHVLVVALETNLAMWRREFDDEEFEFVLRRIGLDGCGDVVGDLLAHAQETLSEEVLAGRAVQNVSLDRRQRVAASGVVYGNMLRNMEYCDLAVYRRQKLDEYMEKLARSTTYSSIDESPDFDRLADLERVFLEAAELSSLYAEDVQ